MSLQGKHVRFGPLPLPDSKQLRLKRYYPDAVYKPATDQVSRAPPDDPPGRRRAAARPGAAGVVRAAALAMCSVRPAPLAVAAGLSAASAVPVRAPSTSGGGVRHERVTGMRARRVIAVASVAALGVLSLAACGKSAPDVAAYVGDTSLLA